MIKLLSRFFQELFSEDPCEETGEECNYIVDHPDDDEEDEYCSDCFRERDP